MQIEVGNIVEGKVASITKFGAFIDLPGGSTGMVHISEVAASYVKDISEHLNIGDTVKAKVINITEDGKISLSIKKAIERPQAVRAAAPKPKPSFEDMLKKFQQTSEDKMSDLKRSMNNKQRGYSRRGSK